MNSEITTRYSYQSLFAHNIIQYIIYFILFFAIIIVLFNFILPFIQYVVIEDYLEGKVANNGQMESLSKESNSIIIQTKYYTRWSIDIYSGTPQEARYWFNPVLALSFPIILLSFILSLLITNLLPVKYGLMRHKVERELMNVLDNWHYSIFGNYSEDNNQSFINQIKQADTKEIYTLADKWGILAEDLKNIQKVLKWSSSSAVYQFFNILTSVKFYLRFYFTDRYSNVVLGLVYIGAAVLIIIIGMRGLKFIPSSQPSLVFFALGLEFSVLLTYAFTVIYSRNDNENPNTNKSNTQLTSLLSDDFGNSKEVENLLRAFLKSGKNYNK